MERPVEREAATPLLCDPRLLVVDPSEAGRRALTRLLRRPGVEVIEAKTGGAAVEMIRRAPPDLVLLDLATPQRSGLDTLSQIRLYHDPSSLPVIIVTTRNEQESATECFAAGANDFVVKPILWPVLRARIETHLGLHFAHAALAEDRAQLEATVEAQLGKIEMLRELLLREPFYRPSNGEGAGENQDARA
jgi:DNA-binding response OmpR family regulator